MNDFFTAYRDNVAFGTNLVADMSRVAVDLHLTAFDKFLGLAGTKSAFGQIFLKSYGFVFHIILPLL